MTLCPIESTTLFPVTSPLVYVHGLELHHGKYKESSGGYQNHQTTAPFSQVGTASQRHTATFQQVINH